MDKMWNTMFYRAHGLGLEKPTFCQVISYSLPKMWFKISQVPGDAPT